MGVVFDPLGAAMGAAMGAIFGPGGPVVVNGMICGNTGTEVKNIPHFPTPPGVSPAPMDAPPGNEGTLVTGSKTVEFMGSSESRTLSMVMDCNYPLNLPTGVCGAVPMGMPVLIGGPEAMDFAAAATQAIRTKWVSGKLNDLLGATKGSKRQKAICFLTGHPVDVVTGELIAEATDAEFPGTIELRFERNYRSRETESQSLGPGWYHFFDSYIEERPGMTAFRHPDGRPAEHPPLAVGDTYFHKPDRYSISRDLDGYRLRTDDGRIYFYKPTEPARKGVALRNRLAEIRDRGRNVITLEWKGPFLARVVDTAQRVIACRYTRDGLLNRLVLQNGAEEIGLVDYDYEAGRLARATDPRRNAMKYAYRGGVLIKEVHRDGLTFHFEWDWYDPEGWCVRTWGDASDGDPAVMDLAPGGTPPRAIYDRRIIYDKHRHRTMVSDLRGGNTVYEGNALDLVDKIIDPTGLVTKTEWNEHAWKVAEENGNGERYEWTYDDRGNRLVEKDPMGRETHWTYDELDRVTGVRTPRGGTYTVEYDRSDRPRSVTRPDGAAITYTHDEYGRLVALDDPMGRGYRLTWSARHDLASVTDGEKRTTSYVSDLFGRLTSAKDPLGRTLRAERDAKGNVTYLERFDGERLTMRYDVEDRVTEQTDSQGRRVTMRYAGTGRLVEHTDPMGHRVRLRYDSEEDLIAVENQAGDLYTFELDLAGKVKRESSFAGHRRLYAYDNAGRVDRVASGFHRATKLMRDPLGRVIESVSRGGDTRILGGAQPEIETYQYDELGDLIRASTPGADTVFERDDLGRIVREQQRVHASEREVSVASRYDRSGLRVERSTSLLHETRYDHNNAGDLVGVSADWTIGDRGIFKGLGLPQAAAGPFEIRFARDALGQELARRLPGGVSAVWTRDAFGRPVEQRVVTGARSDRPGTDVMRKGYAWQSPDQIASIRELNPATGLATRGSSYEYDTRGHLIRQIFSSGEVLERQSDAVGNLYRSADRSDRVYGKGGVLQRANGTEYTFDADGFLSDKTLSDGAKWAYSWNAQGQLREVTRPDKKKVAFAYDAFGRRVRKEFEGKVTEYVWDGDDLVHERVSEAGKELPLVTWLFEPGTFAPVAKIEGRKRFGIVSDHLGVPSAVMTEAGRIAWRAQLDVYGVPREESAVAEEADRTANPWRFPGQYEDAETGLYYNRFRYYDPAIGRYISEDPIGLLGGVPLFGYVRDPGTYSDPCGLACEGKLPKRLRNKRKRILNQTAAGGNRSITGVLSNDEAMTLGEDFVGPRFRQAVLPNGSTLMLSEDGLRQFRGPAQKHGVNPMTAEPWSKTGTQVNFQSRAEPEGAWTSNVHADVAS